MRDSDSPIETRSAVEGSAVDVGPYVDGIRRRARLWAKECEKAQRAAKADAKKIALRLSEAGAARVILFGSLASGDGFTPLSDIDLAVEGITWSEYWRVFSEVSKLTSFGVDLVVLEDASPELRRRVFQEGEDLSHGC
ncbi:MAG: nucleotidyltransferase domain-containing protein [Firmicutes bacterium]|jgi:predicted nucleotidyltransferase|nr:nucleotidyltransferase domain-containing protein [Bacillota bacterium]MDH7495330.1 nucleotidyltransferase domain-containing protein [Bacillota bacterium]